MSKRIYIIEDDENIREMVRMALTSFSYEVAAFDNAEEGLAAIYNSMPDMVIFDIMLPGMSGLDATKQLRDNPKTGRLPVILLTAKNTEIDKVAGLDCGADDYIAKPFSVMELAARIRALFRRVRKSAPQPAENIEISGLYINNNTREVTLNNIPLDLTYKEHELLSMLAKDRDRIIPREELLNRIWGYDFTGESRTLDMHIRALRHKLDDDAENSRYIKTVRNVGYRFIAK
ncbi:MAG: response regulator transcription factor [Oscillospiraceae bacterium]|nr:response regulator transcription factor [Oscillospiraceae bacterium]